MTAALAMRGRGPRACPAWPRVSIAAPAPLSTPPGPVLPSRPVPPPVLPVPGLPVPPRPVLARPVLLLLVLVLLVLAVLLARLLGLVRRGRGSGRVGRGM